tara:strand:- start:105 stop:1274 length:1170 start_codon:yes stop_codon:yes gene_type:complete
MKNNNYNFKTNVIHAGYQADTITGSVMPPIYLSTTYKQSAPGKPIGEFEYSRSSNPNRQFVEQSLATLEGGHFGLCFASGCAALAIVLQTLPTGAHVVVSDDVYGGTLRLFAQVYKQKGIDFTQVDCTDLAQFKQALTPKTELIWIETPSNPMLKIIDIEQIANIKNTTTPEANLFVDNTFASPYLQNPLALGADGVCHSTTKYLGGHSDVVGGALIVNKPELNEKLAYMQNALGAVPSAMDCYLLMRSIKTLAIRMDAHCQNAQKVVTFLNSHPKVDNVLYPGLPEHPQYHVAEKQMKNFGGMISTTFKLDLNQVKSFLGHLQLFTLAESLGGVESLIEHPAIMTHATIPPAQRKALGISDGLVRLSVGIEDADDLIWDLKEALEHVK